MVRSTDTTRRRDERLVSAAVLGLATAGGLWWLARSPQARRVAWHVVRFVALTWVPSKVMTEVRSAWVASGDALAPTPAAAREDAEHA